MSAARHTPGPWRVAPKHLYGATDGIHIDAGSRSYIAHVGAHGDERAEADARLIAAAPELRQALADLAETVKGELRESGESLELMHRLSAAFVILAQAEGRA